MNLDPHEFFRKKIDESLAGPISPQEERTLQEHLGACMQCQQYQDSSARVVASLSGFSFEVDPALNAKVSAALAQRAQQKSVTRINWSWLVGCSLFAAGLTLLGSLIDLRLGSAIASVFDIQQLQARHDLLTFWILPSLSVLLVFPLLPLLTTVGHPPSRSVGGR